jgi:hypothetical protein
MHQEPSNVGRRRLGFCRRRRISDDEAVRYLLKGADASDRGDILVEIIEIVRQAAHDLPPDQPDPFDDAPGG